MAFFAGARAKPSPVIRLFSVLVDKSSLDIKLVDESGAQAFQPPNTNDEIVAFENPQFPRQIRKWERLLKCRLRTWPGAVRR